MIAVDVLVANLWMGFYFMELKNQIKLTKWKQIMPYSRIRKKLEEEQAGKEHR
jgi:hypothetical protein